MNRATKNPTTEIVCAGKCGRSTTDPDLWDPCIETGKTYCDECWPNRTRNLGFYEVRVTETADGFDVSTRTETGGLSSNWSHAGYFADEVAVGEMIAEDIAYRRKVER